MQHRLAAPQRYPARSMVYLGKYLRREEKFFKFEESLPDEKSRVFYF